MKQIIFTIAFMLVLAGSAAAQRPTGGTELFAASSLSFTGLSGIEASAGTVDIEDNTRWGQTFTVRNEDANLTMTLNYSSHVQSLDAPNQIVGGTWTMNVYKNGQYRGTLFGEVVGGKLEWEANRTGTITAGSISALLKVNGGTDYFANVTVANSDLTTGNFTGDISYSQNQHPKVNGFVDLLF